MDVYYTDIGTDYRIATISGNPDACSRAHRMVMDIIAEVTTTYICHLACYLMGFLKTLRAQILFWDLSIF